MPEMPEVEAYRRLAEARALRRRIVAVDAPDSWFLKRETTAQALTASLVGRRFSRARRIGKLLLLDVAGGPTLGLRFGMTGRLLVDGHAGVDRLRYSSDSTTSSGGELDAWDRFGVRFAGGGELRIRDPRRLGGVELEPDESRLGPDLLGISAAELRDALAGSAAPLKARLMDQSRVAGVGNLIADEALWRAAIHPARQAGTLTTTEVRRLHKHLRASVDDLLERGGSHLGDIIEHRVEGGRCPRCRVPLQRTTVGGRTSYWCPKHQR